MGFGRLGAHVNMTVSGLPEAIAEWKPSLVVLLDHSDVWHSVKAESPQTVFVGRVVQTDEPDFNDSLLDPIAAARRHCNALLPWAERMGETYDFWQGVNEPIIRSGEAMRRLATFESERTRLMARHGFRVVVGSFSVGNPKLRHWQQFLPALEAVREHAGGLALHEYAWPTLDHEAPWYLLRHRKVYEGEPTHRWEGMPAHLKRIPLYVTECGLDGLIAPPHRPRGWKAITTPDEYLQQLAWFDTELQQDPYVKGAAIYCLASPDPQWKSYDIWPEPAKTLTRQAVPSTRFTPRSPAQPYRLPETGWNLTIEHVPGAPILAGSMPLAGIRLVATDQWGNARLATSGTKPEYGIGGFEMPAPYAATYTIAFLSEEFSLQTRGGTTLLTLTPDSTQSSPRPEPGSPPMPAPPVGWRMAVQRRPGARVLAGSFPEAGIALTASDAWGNITRTMSGSKPEYGPGGFEVLAPHITSVRLSFLGKSFEIQTHDGVTLVTFDRSDPLPPEPLHHSATAADPVRQIVSHDSSPPTPKASRPSMLGKIISLFKRLLTTL
jgi:hypothetical protein